MRPLPPLNALRAFEAAARFESFNRAAEDLHVTPSAVSHQIKGLEEFLGVVLFRRLTRQVKLTPEGRIYLAAVRDALEQIRIATERIGRHQRTGPLTISAAPAFAAGWLMPRLNAFQLEHPEIEVRLNAAVELVDFARSDVDVGIRTGKGQWTGLQVHRLMSEALVPVCSPRLLQGPGALKLPEDLPRATLLHELPRIGQWRTWLCAVDLCDIDPERGPKFQNAAMAVEAAVAGLGIAIADRRLVAGHLEEGRLVMPFDVDLPSEYAFYLVYPKERATHPKIAAFRDWLLAQVAEEPAQAAEMQADAAS
jgi:LysR family glycine cleavage system transcriptional activator